MTTENVGLTRPEPGGKCCCGSGRLFADCCEAIITGRRPAATAEELMRARFSAHVIRDFAFLHRTYAATASQPFVEEDSAPEIHWTRLEIHAHEPGTRPDTAFVEFSAYYTDQGHDLVLQEKSEFLRVSGEWIFNRTVRQGPAPIKAAAPKPGRNEPCPCGSGKKYKHCCLLKA